MTLNDSNELCRHLKAEVLFLFLFFFVALSNKKNSTHGLVINCPSCSFSQATEVPTISFRIEKELVFNNDIRTEPETTEIN